jgi:hypothetical protein
MNELPEVTEVQRLRLEPGDRLVVRADRELTQHQTETIPSRVRAALHLPDDFPVMVIPAGFSVEVVTPSAESGEKLRGLRT